MPVIFKDKITSEVIGSASMDTVMGNVVTAQPEAETEASVDNDLVAEYITLYSKLEEIGGAKMIARMETIKKQLHSSANAEGDDDSPFVYDTPQGKMTFGPRSTTRELVDVFSLLNKIENTVGTAAAESCVSLKMGTVSKLISEHELQNFVHTTPGSRSLKSVEVK